MSISIRERVLGGLWGSLVGDALGVPVEFRSRADVQLDPVTEMRGYGSHRQPAGTWSDDSSLLLCSVDSLLRHTFDTEDLGQRFVKWHNEAFWTPHGKVFDVGVATSHALTRIAQGMRAESAGGDGQYSNGNGSLMRIIPVSLRFANGPLKECLDRVHRASAITHRHPRSQLACGFFTLMIRELLHSSAPSAAYAKSLEQFRAFYEPDPWWSAEFEFLQLLLAGDLSNRPEAEISSGGYVIHTLTASIWCLLTTSSFEDCVLRAVNLGGDTDTTGCVAGGLAGLHYGISAIPSRWIETLARREEIAPLVEQFAEICATGLQTDFTQTSL
jgi:ADP-ribosyl-[dinitrogen reductase] hydrolase